MDTQQNQPPQDTERLKEIPKWTRRYTQNRTIPFLVSLVLFFFLFFSIAGSSYLLREAMRLNNALLAGAAAIILVLSLVALVFFSIPKWGGKFIESVASKVYGAEGTTALHPKTNTRNHKLLGLIVGLVFAACVITSAELGAAGYLPIEYMQPMSAVYVVPFLVFLFFWQRPKIGPLSLLWPGLYAIHAILIILGAPILFTGNLIPLNMILPVFGYGFLTYIIGYFYSRYALKKLKEAATVEQEATDGV